jgi:hypothetical protein
MNAVVDPREPAAAHWLARVFIRTGTRAKDLTLSKICSPCA